MISAKEFDEKILNLENWLKTQHHLPQCVQRIVLKRFIYATHGDLEKAKSLLDLNFTMRTTYSHIFLKRDPCDTEIQKVLKSTDMLSLPGTNPTGDKVLLYKLAEHDPNKFDFNPAVQLFFMFADARFVSPDNLAATEMPIYDMTGFTLRHLAKVVLSTLRIYMKFVQEAHPVRLRVIHVINCPSFLDKVLMVVKPFIKSEVFKMIKFHLPNSNTLYEDVPKDMLPFEYGGKAGSIADLKNQWVNHLMQNREYLSNEKYWKVNESKRCQSKQQVEEIKDSFRSLIID